MIHSTRDSRIVIVALGQAVDEHPASRGTAGVLDPDTHGHSIGQTYRSLGKEVSPCPHAANAVEIMVDLILQEDGGENGESAGRYHDSRCNSPGFQESTTSCRLTPCPSPHPPSTQGPAP
jgi:hypothetical protein